MEFGDYVGFNAADYAALSEYSAIMSYLEGKIKEVTIGGQKFYVFTGEDWELLELLEGYPDLSIEVLWFSYQKSTWSTVGF